MCAIASRVWAEIAEILSSNVKFCEMFSSVAVMAGGGEAINVGCKRSCGDETGNGDDRGDGDTFWWDCKVSC